MWIKVAQLTVVYKSDFGIRLLFKRKTKTPKKIYSWWNTETAFIVPKFNSLWRRANISISFISRWLTKVELVTLGLSWKTKHRHRVNISWGEEIKLQSPVWMAVCVAPSCPVSWHRAGIISSTPTLWPGLLCSTWGVQLGRRTRQFDTQINCGVIGYLGSLWHHRLAFILLAMSLASALARRHSRWGSAFHPKPPSSTLFSSQHTKSCLVWKWPNYMVAQKKQQRWVSQKWESFSLAGQLGRASVRVYSKDGMHRVGSNWLF